MVNKNKTNFILINIYQKLSYIGLFDSHKVIFKIEETICLTYFRIYFLLNKL